jgi:hypothetical protein
VEELKNKSRRLPRIENYIPFALWTNRKEFAVRRAYLDEFSEKNLLRMQEFDCRWQVRNQQNKYGPKQTSNWKYKSTLGQRL